MAVLKLGNHGRRTLLSIMVFLAVMIVFSQFWALPSGTYISTLLPGEASSPLIMIQQSSPSLHLFKNGTFDMVEGVGENRLTVQISEHVVASSKELASVTKAMNVDSGMSQSKFLHNNASRDDVDQGAINMDVSANYSTAFGQTIIDTTKPLGTGSFISASSSSLEVHKVKQVMEFEAGSKNDSSKIARYVRKMRGATITLSEMNIMLLNRPTFFTSVKRRRSSSIRDRQLRTASLQIKNAPVIRNLLDLHAPLFRNASVFKRSYDLMDHLLKVYVYKEGEKPIFHHPRLRGLYVAEGWFMNLLERSKRFTVRDPRKAHLFYLPFSSETLRTTLYDEKSHSIKDLEHYLTNYLDLIKTRYRFWNRTGGADHFFVACHDWGPRITRNHMSSCIRGLCNANVARGFSVGKDVSVPVTYIRSGNDPTRDIGGKPPSERNILAFFAGQLHGYLRPLLLQYWENKVPDMKILGPMQRDVQSKAVYRDYMKSSKYCICARGYGVHTPRVVESIFYECIPVIISDNYVPPFFEVLDWETFAVFVLEKDIPNLRNILLSISEARYLNMQQKIRMVQRHFIWHKTPEKYDLFHMILHSIWYNRVSQIKSA